MTGFWQTVADGAGTLVATPCEMLSAAAQYVAQAARRLQPGGGGPAAMGAVVQDQAIAQVIEWISVPACSALRAEFRSEERRVGKECRL